MKIDTTKPKVTVGCKVPKEVRVALEKLAAKEGVKLSPYVERTLLAHVRERQLAVAS